MPTIIRAQTKKITRVAPADGVKAVEDNRDIFIVKGPMGKGLGIRESGVHIAFAAGTGVLVFLDLVMRLILHNTGALKAGFDDSFKFIFYISHQNLNETMGMDLSLKLIELNKHLGFNNFDLVVRLSEGHPDLKGEKPKRWNKEAIKEELMQFAGQLSKIWVCGPPMLNQTFDIALEQLQDELKIERN